MDEWMDGLCRCTVVYLVSVYWIREGTVPLVGGGVGCVFGDVCYVSLVVWVYV